MSDLFAFLFGTVFGSFLNVVIYRLPREESIVRPGSHCTFCRAPILWYDNIPILSFVILGARCRQCRVRISFRYPIVELLTGFLFLWIWRHSTSTLQALVGAFLVSSLLVVSAVDLEHQIIPDEVSLGGLAVGILVSPIVPSLHGEVLWWKSLVESVTGALAGGTLIYGTGVVGSMIFRKEAMGGGDVKLMAMLGAFLGWQKVVLVYLLAPILALPMGLFLKFSRRIDVIPYGPFLSVAGWISFLWGQALIDWYWGGWMW